METSGTSGLWMAEVVDNAGDFSTAVFSSRDKAERWLVSRIETEVWQVMAQALSKEEPEVLDVVLGTTPDSVALGFWYGGSSLRDEYGPGSVEYGQGYESFAIIRPVVVDEP